MSKDLVDLQDDLHEKQVRLNFLFRAFAALASEAVDISLRPTEFEAYQGTMLGQELVEKMVTHTEETLKKHLQKTS